VRAAVIDKDRQPRWQPSALAAVTEAETANLAAPSGTRLAFA
jgi:enoyl-CoA hydratase